MTGVPANVQFNIKRDALKPWSSLKIALQMAETGRGDGTNALNRNLTGYNMKLF